MAALEAQRSILGDALVETLLASMRQELAALETRLQPEQVRKQATVLFADVSGFTTFAETMDAEDVARVMNDLWTVVDRVILDHGGRIDKHIGDAVMAVWGAESAREDDPERAVRAALAMQAAVGAFSATGTTALTIGPQQLGLRIGVNTGPVLLGQVGTRREFTAIGDAVNLASRLERLCPVGDVLIAHDTYRHIRGIFDVQPRQPLSVRGRVGPVQTYVVLQAKPRAFRMATRGVEGIETRMIGREAELSALQAAYRDVMERGEARVVTVIGEAGVGKSRLLYEFDNWLELRPETVLYFKGRATPNMQNVPYSLFRDLFANRFEIFDSDGAAVALDKFRHGMDGGLAADLADVVGHWLGFDFSSSAAVQRLLGGAGLPETARAFLVRYFRALTGPSPSGKGLGRGPSDAEAASANPSLREGDPNPTVILLEDIHWADDASLELVAYLAAALPQARLLMVAVTRASLFERRPGWGQGPAALRQVVLRPLPVVASRALVDEILQRVDQVPDSLRDLIVAGAEGNPFYLEELVKMLLEQGVIERGIRNEDQPPATDALNTERWTVSTVRLASLKVPPTLTALLQARLDGLPPLEREVLQRASVIGRIFWDDAVAELMATDRQQVITTLEAVRERELIFRRESSAFAAAAEYIFKHALLRDVTYETVLLKHRVQYHDSAARWLENHAGDRLGEYLSLIAEHYSQAGQEQRAASLLQKSGEEALLTGAFAAARRVLERALALREAAGETNGPAVTAALIGLGRACISLGDLAAAEAALARGLAGARAAQDSGAEAEALAALAAVSADRGDYGRARALAEAALPLGQALGGQRLILVVQRAASILWVMGDLAAAEGLATEALTASRAGGDLVGELSALYMLGNIFTDRRELERAVATFEMVLKLSRRANHLSHEAKSLVNLGNIAYLRGDYAAARQFGQSARGRFQELGQQRSVVVSLGNLSQTDLKLGDTAAARRGAREALALARSLGAQPWVLWAVFLCGQILAETGDVSRALALYGLARAHPAVDNQVRVEIDEEVARLAVPAAEVEAGLAAGAGLDLEAVVGEILGGQW